MPDLRALAAIDARTQNLTDWALPIVLIDPEGNVYDTDNVTGAILKAVQVLYDRRGVNPATGEEIMIKEPVVTVARKSLSRIPADGEVWFLRMPEDPEEPSVLSDFVLDGARAPEGGQSLNFIRLYPHRLEASE